jgi:hypothetical protein
MLTLLLASILGQSYESEYHRPKDTAFQANGHVGGVVINSSGINNRVVVKIYVTPEKPVKSKRLKVPAYKSSKVAKVKGDCDTSLQEHEQRVAQWYRESGR